MSNKKVLLRERKRHTARHVASTPYVVLTGYPPPWPGRGGGEYPDPPPGRVPLPPPAGPGRVPPPPSGCPMAFWEMLQSIMGYWYPPPPPGVDKLTKWNYCLPVVLRTAVINSRKLLRHSCVTDKKNVWTNLLPFPKNHFFSFIISNRLILYSTLHHTFFLGFRYLEELLLEESMQTDVKSHNCPDNLVRNPDNKSTRST